MRGVCKKKLKIVTEPAFEPFSTNIQPSRLTQNIGSTQKRSAHSVHP